MNKYRGYKFYLMLLWPPAVFMTYPPIYAGPVLSVDKPEKKSFSSEVNSTGSNSKDDLSKEIQEIDLSLPAPVVKRTDIKRLLETGEARTCATRVMINGNVATCDHPECTQPPVNFWYDSETGCRSCRCALHK